MPESDMEMARQGFELWNLALSHDDEAIAGRALRELVDAYRPDAELDNTRILPDFPASRGPHAIVDAVTRARDAFANLHFEPTDYIVASGALVVPVILTGTGRLSGAPMKAKLAYVFRYEQAQVVSQTTFATLAEALEAAGSEE